MPRTSTSMNMPASGTQHRNPGTPASASSTTSRRAAHNMRVSSAVPVMPRAVTAASWMNPGNPKSMHITSASACATRGADHQPARAPPRHRVGFGQAADGHHLFRKHRGEAGHAAAFPSPAYTSSATIHSECRRARSPMNASSAAFNTTPLGLPGREEPARVRGVIAASKAARSGRKPAARARWRAPVSRPILRWWPDRSDTADRGR